VVEQLTNCSKNHQLCGSIRESQLPTRVLDVSDGSIKLRESHGSSGQYVCLSHCWGKKQMITTTTANYQSHLTMVSWHALPKTFQDTIDFTRRLGVKFLWIDSLCIVQDDRDDWEIEAGRMASVYENSLVTLSASSASDSSMGCYSSPAATNIAHSLAIAPPTDAELPENTQLPTHRNILVRERLHHIRLRDTRTRTMTDLSRIFPLESRAWCFQERMLSPRTINFTIGEISWECREVSGCECTPHACSNKRWSASVDLKSKHYLDQYKGGDPEFRIRWRQCVIAYSTRHLTRSEDIFPALLGLVD
jgi:hypothetical protein